MLLLAAASALGWTFFDFSRRQVGERLPAVPTVVCIMVLQTLLCLPFGGWSTVADQDSKWFLFAGLSILVNTIANTLFVLSVQRAAFTLVVPLLSLSPVLSAAVGWAVFGESLELRQILAILTVVGAALWLGWNGEGRKLTRSEKVAMLMMSTTAFLWAITPFLDRYCTANGTVPLTVYVGTQCFGIAVALLLVAAPSAKLRAGFRGLWPKLRIVGPWVLLAAIAAAVGLYFQIQGILNVSHVGLFEAVKRSLTMLISLALGRFVLKEHLTRGKIVAAFVMAIGIFLLA